MSIFSKIVKKEIPADIVYESEKVLAFRDIKPQAPVHVLVISKEEIPSLQELKDPSIMAEITEAIQKIAEKEGIADTGYRVVTNAGADSGQEVPHLHFHILGGRKMTWPPG